MADEKHLKILLADGYRAWAEWREQNRDLRPDLKDADLQGADLQNYNLKRAILTNANLSNADLRFANLENANLDNAVLQGANLSHVRSMSVNLRRANLSGANMTAAKLTYAKCEGADLANAILIGAELARAEFQSADLSNAELTGAILGRANFAAATLSNATLVGANLVHANFLGADLTGADLTNAYLGNADFQHASLREAKFVHADLSNTKIFQADLSAADLAAAVYLVQTQLNGAHSDVNRPPSIPTGLHWDPTSTDSAQKTMTMHFGQAPESQQSAENRSRTQQAPRPRNVIPIGGQPDGRHICASTIGIGGGLLGVTAVFIPYRGNIGSEPGQLAELVGWEGAEDYGHGASAIERTLDSTGETLIDLGVPGDGITDFLAQLRTESWITFSASPLGSGPMPDDPHAVIRHPKQKSLFAILVPYGVIVFFVTNFFGAPVGELGKGFVSEITGIENFEEFGRTIGKDSIQSWREVLKTIARVSGNETQRLPGAASEPRAALRPSEPEE